MSIGVVTTVRSGRASISDFIHYHLNIGVSKILLFLDDTGKRNNDLHFESDRVQTASCDPSYWRDVHGCTRPDTAKERQDLNLEYARNVFQRDDVGYMISLDIDELIHPLRPDALKELDNIFRKLENVDGLKLRRFEACPSRLHYERIFDVELFRVRVSADTIQCAKSLGCRHAGFRDPKPPKVIMPVIADPDHQGIHPKKTFILSDLFHLLNYTCIGYENFIETWNEIADKKSTETSYPYRQKQLEMYRRARSNGEKALKSFYRRRYFLDIGEREILERLGILKTVSINPDLFGKCS